MNSHGRGREDGATMSDCFTPPTANANANDTAWHGGQIGIRPRTEFSQIPIKDVVIVFFMLSLWLYSIMLIVRAWAKIHNLPDSGLGGSMWRFVIEYLQKKRKGLVDDSNRNRAKDEEESSSKDSLSSPRSKQSEENRSRVLGSPSINLSNSKDHVCAVTIHPDTTSNNGSSSPAPSFKLHHENEVRDQSTSDLELFEIINSKMLERLASDEVVQFDGHQSKKETHM